MSNSTLDQANEKLAWSLDQWLEYLHATHPNEIELGLDRVRAVYQRLAISFDSTFIITVAGTNGKGTTCAMVEQGLLVKNKTVAVFSSPHLIDYRERVRVQGHMLNEAAHCAAFLAVDQARADIPLTYFEFGTLAALYLIHAQQVEYALLEVGLGGRLDAINVVDPNLAVITGIDLDHQDWLGDTKELIAIEKAGIFRANIPAVIGDPEPPSTLIQATKDYQVQPYWQGRDFSYHVQEGHFNWRGTEQTIKNLPVPHIPAQNASTALQILHLLNLTFSPHEMHKVFESTRLPGRKQLLSSAPTVMLDVAHNPQATRLLATEIASQKFKKVIAVVAMLSDKDIAASLTPMVDVVDVWHCASLSVPRGAAANELVSVLSGNKKVLDFENVTLAYQEALNAQGEQDCVICFGSFFTVAEILNLQKSLIN